MFIDQLKNLQGVQKVYLQTFEGGPVNDASFTANMGFKCLNLDVETVDHTQINNLEVHNGTMFCGGVPFVKDGLRHLGIDIPKPLDYPKELLPYCQRRMYFTDLQGLLDLGEYPIFVKPSEESKLFVGVIVGSAYELDMFKAYQGLDLPVVGSEVLDIVSEYRCFVINGEVYDCRRYNGDYRTLPDYDLIDEMVAAYKSSPVAYSIDVGVTSDGKTVLIECNDGYSLGTYGFD